MSSLVTVIHGDSGVGKSRLGVTSPLPLLVVDAEGGSRFAIKQSGRTFTNWDGYGKPPSEYEIVHVTLRDFSTLESITGWLASGNHPFVSVVFDSITEIQKRCLDLVSPGVASVQTQQWGELLRRMEGLVRQYRDLVVEETDGNPLRVVVWLAISGEVDDKIRPWVKGQLARTFKQYVDCIGYLKEEVDLADGASTRTLMMKGDWRIDAKDRTDVFPASIPNPNISEMYELMKENDV